MIDVELYDDDLPDDGADALALLARQHRDLEALFQAIARTSAGFLKTRERLLSALAHQLEMHAQLEEKLFYRACRAIDEAWTNQASEEHELMRRLLRRLEHMPPADDAFRPQAAMLENLVQTHIAKEEEALFPRVREETSDERLLTLGRDLRAMAAHLRTLRDGPARAAEVPDLAHT